MTSSPPAPQSWVTPRPGSSLGSPHPGFLHLNTFDILVRVTSLCGAPVHCRVSIARFLGPVACPNCDHQKSQYCQYFDISPQTSLVEKHCLRRRRHSPTGAARALNFPPALHSALKYEIKEHPAAKESLGRTQTRAKARAKNGNYVNKLKLSLIFKKKVLIASMK